MPAKIVKQHGTLPEMRQQRRVRLDELIRRKREQLGWGLREAARACSLPPMTLLNAERGARPTDETLTALSQGYDLPRETLALAAYGEYFEDVSPISDVTGPLESPPPPADSVGEQEWKTTGRRRLRAIAST